MKHILLTTDLSEEAQRAFLPVANLAQVLGAKITLLHVVQLLTPVAPGVMVADPLPVQGVEQDRKKALDVLAEQRELLPRDVEVTLDVRTAGDIPRGVCEYAAEQGVGLIALSSHGRSGIKRLVLGSVAEGILRHAHVPVLCFPPPA